MESTGFGSLHAHLDRVERMTHTQLCNTREDTGDEPTIVLCRRRFGGLALSDGLIAVGSSVWIRDGTVAGSMSEFRLNRGMRRRTCQQQQTLPCFTRAREYQDRIAAMLSAANRS